jgi:hypothetical protein
MSGDDYSLDFECLKNLFSKGLNSPVTLLDSICPPGHEGDFDSRTPRVDLKHDKMENSACAIPN